MIRDKTFSLSQIRRDEMTLVWFAQKENVRGYVAKLDTTECASQCPFPFLMWFTEGSVFLTCDCVCMVLDKHTPAWNRHAVPHWFYISDAVSHRFYILDAVSHQFYILDAVSHRFYICSLYIQWSFAHFSIQIIPKTRGIKCIILLQSHFPFFHTKHNPLGK